VDRTIDAMIQKGALLRMLQWWRQSELDPFRTHLISTPTGSIFISAWMRILINGSISFFILI